MNAEHPGKTAHDPEKAGVPDAKMEDVEPAPEGPSAQENLAKLHQDYIKYNLINNDVLLALLDQLTPAESQPSEAKAHKASK